MAIEIKPEDVADAEEFLATLLTENVPNGKFTKGTALRDLVIKGFSYIIAHLKKENETVRSLQSLRSIQNIATDDPDVDRAVSDGVDAILSNWFINRKSGGFARGTINIRVSRKQDYLVPPTNRFVYNRNLVFFPDVPDTTETIIIPSTDVFPIVGSDGQINSYFFTLRVVSSRTGEDYEVTPSEWTDYGRFSPLIIGVSNSEKFSGGRNRETTPELIDRSSTAIAVRNLINPRSVDAVLRDTFTELRRLLTIGYGDPEMQRDLRNELASGLEMHVGGHFDVYVELPVTQTSFEGQIGGIFTRPDNIANVFRDDTIADWTLEAIQVGDILRVTSGIDEAPKDFTIHEILAGELRISTLNPFSVPTDEDSTFVDYFIYRPLFGADAQVLPTVSANTTGVTSRRTQTEGRVLLPGGPHYDIVDIAVINPDPSDPNINGGDGFVHFPVRVNEEPITVTDPENLQYQVTNREPSQAQSQLAFDEVLVDPAYDGKILRIKYDTLAGFSAVHDFLRDRFERILCANALAKGYFPVYLAFEVPYRRKPSSAAVIDEDNLNESIVTFINNFDPNDVIDVSDIIQHVREYSTDIGTVFPFDITYTLHVSDGRVITYRSSDIVELSADKLVEEDEDALDNPAALSLSDRTVRYLTTASRIAVVEQ